MIQGREAGRSRQQLLSRIVWYACGAFMAWVIIWGHQGASMVYMMILMFLLASAATVTLSVRIGDHERFARHAEDFRTFEQLLKAVYDMAEVLTAARVRATSETTPTDSPNLRLVTSGQELPEPGAEWSDAASKSEL